MTEKYLMESPEEAERLLAQEDALQARPTLLSTGLKAGMKALDAGCGPGGVSQEMASIVGPDGRVTGIDASAERIAAAQKRRGDARHLSFQTGDIHATGFADASFDYVWSQYVFEYLREPQKALAELVRVTRPGGKIVVADIDGSGIFNWPEPEIVTRGIRSFLELTPKVGFDSFIGRKLFSLFKQQGLHEVKVHLLPLNLAAGTATARLVNDWTTRLRTLAPLLTQGLGDEATYNAFVSAYLDMLRSPDALKYSLTLVTEGIKAG